MDINGLQAAQPLGMIQLLWILTFFREHKVHLGGFQPWRLLWVDFLLIIPETVMFLRSFDDDEFLVILHGDLGHDATI